MKEYFEKNSRIGELMTEKTIDEDYFDSKISVTLSIPAYIVDHIDFANLNFKAHFSDSRGKISRSKTVELVLAEVMDDYEDKRKNSFLHTIVSKWIKSD